MMYCDSCKAEFSDDISYCKWCGQLLRQRRAMTTTQLSKCYVCSAPMQPEWTFCKSCGTKQEAGSSASVGPMCMRCGAIVQSGAPACQRCGERLTLEKESPYANRHSTTAQAAFVNRCDTCDEPLDVGVQYCKSCGTPVTSTDRPLVDESAETQRSTQVYTSFVPEEERHRSPDKLLSAELPPLPLAHEPRKDTLSAASPFAQPPDDAMATMIHFPTAEDQNTAMFTQPTDRMAGEDNSTAIFKPDKGTSPTEGETRPSSRAEIEELLAPTSIFEAGSEPSIPPESPYYSLLRQPAEAMETQIIEVGKSDERKDSPATHTDELATSETQADHLDSLVTPFGVEAADTDAGQTQIYASPYKPPPAPTPPQEGTETKEFSFTDLPFSSAAQEPSPGTPASAATEVISETISSASPKTQQPAAGTATQVHSPYPSSAPASPFPAAPANRQTKRSSMAILIPVLLALLVGGAVAVWWFTSSTPSPTNTNTATANTNTSGATSNSNPTTTTLSPPEGMVLVEAATYTIGRDDGDDIEKPRHLVTMKAFYIDRTEVTNREYKKFLDATSHQPPADWINGSFKDGQADFPVVNVSWRDAVAYATWAGKRLPTEAEWEAAARGVAGRKYPWGDTWQEGLANVGTSSIAEAGKFANGKSQSGALDMIGNVWEWTADPFKLYPGSTAQLPAAIDPNISYRVIRGGAFDGSKAIDASYRGYADEKQKDLAKTGFRCVKDTQ